MKRVVWCGVAFLVLLLLVVLNGNVSFTGKTISSTESFNLEIEIPPEYQDIAVGQTLWFTTKVLNLANAQRVDVVLEYTLLDDAQQAVASRSETVAVETQASFVGSIDIPAEIKKGEYTLVVEMISDDEQDALGTTTITVVYPDDLGGFFKKYGRWIIIALVILLIIFLVFRLKPIMAKMRKRQQSKSRVKELIKGKLASNKITKEELDSGKLPSTPKKVSNEEKIF